MTQDEYFDELKVLTEKFEADKKELIKRCALGNNPYRSGDVISDHRCSIEITNVKGVHVSASGFPQLVYEGFVVNKGGKRRLDRRSNFVKEVIYQSNLINK